MSLSVKTQGGGGRFYASIFVTGLSETDIVTASNGSKTKTAVWNAAESRWEFTKIADLGTWTVTATNGEKTTTQEVLVDVATEYEIEMSYLLYLYNLGDECEDVTGGWEANKVNISGRELSGTARKDAESFYFLTGTQDASFVTAQKINFAGRSKLYFTGSTSNQIQMQVHTSYSASDGSVGRVGVTFIASGETVDSIDVSGLQDAYYVAVGTGGGRDGRVTAVWLE